MHNCCKEYIEKRPDNMARNAGEPQVFCKKHYRDRNIKKRPVFKKNSLATRKPTLAKQILKVDPKKIAHSDTHPYEFSCLNCYDTLLLSPSKIKSGSDAYAAFCDKRKCQIKKREVKSYICKTRGSYEKAPKDKRKSFAYRHPDIAKQQHKTCSIDLNKKKPFSNDLILLKCTECGKPSQRAIGKTIGHSAFYCKSESCKAAQKNYTVRRQWKTRIANRGTFEEHHPLLAKEWIDSVEPPGVKPSEVPPNVRLNVKWQCSQNEEHTWERNVDGRSTNPGCPTCKSNISRMQFRFASELSHILQIPIEHSKKFTVKGKKIEIDIPLILPDGRKIAIEVDGFEWHKGQGAKDAVKNKRLKDDSWTVIRIRDNRLTQLPSANKNFSVPSNPFYAEQWRKAIIGILDWLNFPTPDPYNAYLAKEKYLSTLEYYNLGGE